MPLILTLLFAFSVHAQLIRPAAVCRCDPQASGDSFENPSKFNFGPFAGQCIDSCRFRRVDILHAGDGQVQVTNLRHGQRYWNARIPTDKVLSAEVGFERFLPGIFHVFLVFHFPARAPVELFSQTSKPERQDVRDIVLSPEGAPPKNGKYNLLDAFFERYLIDVRLLSFQEMRAYSVTKLKHKITLYQLNLTPPQIAEVLRQGLEDGAHNSFRTKYRLFTNNCATKTLSFIEAAAKPLSAPGYLEFFQRSLPVAGPLGTLQVFVQHHLIQGESRSI